MQTEFQFHFSTYDFFFEKEHKFDGVIQDTDNPPDQKGTLEGLVFSIRITPEKNNNKGKATQTGFLFLKVALHKEPAEEIILELLHLVTQQINFNNTGKFELASGLYTGERIPETDDERADVGEKKFFAHMKMVEHIGDPIFDTKQFINQTSKSSDIVLIQQHNHAAQTKHPIDKFVSYYKIIEDLLYSKKRKPAKSVLHNSLSLQKAYQSAFKAPQSDEDYLNFISTIVDIRDKCSHLKRNSDFGYILNDSRIESEVESQLDILHYVTHQLIIENDKNV